MRLQGNTSYLKRTDKRSVNGWLIMRLTAEVRDLLIKIVRTQIGDTSEFRVKVAEAIRDRFRPAPSETLTDQDP